MAVYEGNTGGLGGIGDPKVRSYLYKLNEDLTYMFANLSPEENFHEEARLTYVNNANSVASIEVKADSIEQMVSDELSGVASFMIEADGIKAKVEDMSGNIISYINQSAEEVKINASKITLEGIVTANQNFKILTDGSVEAKNGKFSGTINGANIRGKLSIMCGDEIALEAGDDRNDFSATFGGFTFSYSDEGSGDVPYFGADDGYITCYRLWANGALFVTYGGRIINVGKWINDHYND